MEKTCRPSTSIHILWCIFMGLGHNNPWVKSHKWPQQTWGQRSSRGQWPLVQVFAKKGHCIHILWCVFVGLGPSDPRVESHMCPQQTWGQRSYWGQWPLVSTYFNVFSNLIFTMTAKVWSRKAKAVETCGLRTALYLFSAHFWLFLVQIYMLNFSGFSHQFQVFWVGLTGIPVLPTAYNTVKGGEVVCLLFFFQCPFGTP